MKRLLTILLSIGLCLPVVFEGCKPKIELTPAPDAPLGKSAHTINRYAANVKDLGLFIADSAKKEAVVVAGAKNPSGQLTSIRHVLIYLADKGALGLIQFNDRMLPTEYFIHSLSTGDQFVIKFTNHNSTTGEVTVQGQNSRTLVSGPKVQVNVGDDFQKMESAALVLKAGKNGRIGEERTLRVNGVGCGGWVDAVRASLQSAGCVMTVVAPYFSAKDLVTHGLAREQVTGAAVAMFAANAGPGMVGCKGASESWEKYQKGECVDDPTALDFITACPPGSIAGIIAGVALAAPTGGGSLISADVLTCALGYADLAVAAYRIWARSHGDPHLMTLDGVKYDFQSMGEFIAMRSTTDKFEVQIRYGAAGESSVTFNQAVAIHTGADIVSYELSKPYLYINQSKIELSQLTGKYFLMPGGGRVLRNEKGAVIIVTPNSDQIFCRPGNVEFAPSENRRGKLLGILGNFDGSMSNDGRTRDNKAVNLLRPEELYPTYADSWRIAQSESLFFYENGATTETYTDRTKPNEKRPFNSLSLTDRARAETVCRKAGVSREPELSNCILDVAITGDAFYATLASQVAKANPTDNNFLLLTDFPGKSSDGAVGLAVGDKIYAGLGSRQVDWAMYDPAADKWTLKASFPGGKNSYRRISAFTIGAKIYCVGGLIDNTLTNALWEYDTSTDKWTQRQDVPGAARFNIASFAVNGKGYALFGTIGWGNVGDFPTNSAVYEYNPTTDSWTQRADFPGKPRGNNITSSEYNGMVMLIDGRPFLGGGSGGGAPGNDWYEYIPARDAWVKKANIVIDGEQYFSVGTIGYVLRGNTLLSYDAATDAWSKFPGKEIYLPLSSNTLRGIKQAPVLNGKAYIGLGYSAGNFGVKEWWSFKP